MCSITICALVDPISGWRDAEGDYIFSFRLLRDPDNPNQMIDLAQQTPNVVFSGELLSRFLRRIKGDNTVVRYDP